MAPARRRIRCAHTPPGKCPVSTAAVRIRCAHTLRLWAFRPTRPGPKGPCTQGASQQHTRAGAVVEPLRCCGVGAAQKSHCGRGRGPGPWPPLRGASRPAWADGTAQTLSGMRARAGAARSSLRPFGALPAALCALRAPRLRRGPCPCAGSLRRGAPGAAARARFVARLPPCAALRSPGPPLGPSPPALSLGPCAPLRGSAGARWPRCAWVRAALGCGLPALRSGRPCSASPSPLRFAWPRRAPPGPPASRLRGRLPPAPGALRGPSGRLFRLRPPGLWRAAGALLACPGARCALSRLSGRSVVRASPLLPPRPCRPRWGLPGSAWPPAWGLPPPSRLRRASPWCPAASAQSGLDFPRCLCYSVHAWPVPLLRGLPSGYPWTARKPLDRKAGRFFYALLAALLPTKNHRSAAQDVNRKTRPPPRRIAPSEQTPKCQPTPGPKLRERGKPPLQAKQKTKLDTKTSGRRLHRLPRPTQQNLCYFVAFTGSQRKAAVAPR